MNKLPYLNDFFEQFKKELNEVFPELENNEYEWTLVSGSCGWYDAFKNSCEKCNKKNMFELYEMLDWYESDMFDGWLINVAAYAGYIEKGGNCEEVAPE